MSVKQRRFADDGWAIWVDGDDTSTVYINDWLNPLGQSYVDLAIRIRGVQASTVLNIYIPFPVEREELEDVSLQLQDEGILRATFSAACIIDFKKNARTSEIAYNGRTIDLVHLSCTEHTVRQLSSGSLLSVDLRALRPSLDNDECYFLIRMPHKSLDSIFRKRTNVSGAVKRLFELFTSPVVSEKYGYSIRINEARLLPDEINRLGAFHRQKLKKAVVTLSVNEEYELNDSGCFRIRRLEERLYADYVPKGFSCEDVITYQWNQNREHDLRGHFNFYFSMSKSAMSRSSMLAYLVLILLISIFADFLWWCISRSIT